MSKRRRTTKEFRRETRACLISHTVRPNWRSHVLHVDEYFVNKCGNRHYDFKEEMYRVDDVTASHVLARRVVLMPSGRTETKLQHARVGLAQWFKREDCVPVTVTLPPQYETVQQNASRKIHWNTRVEDVQAQNEFDRSAKEPLNVEVHSNCFACFKCTLLYGDDKRCKKGRSYARAHIARIA